MVAALVWEIGALLMMFRVLLGVVLRGRVSRWRFVPKPGVNSSLQLHSKRIFKRWSYQVVLVQSEDLGACGIQCGASKAAIFEAEL